VGRGGRPPHRLDPERMGDASPGYTANRAVNAIPFVCAAEPGIRTTADLPQIIANLSRQRELRAYRAAGLSRRAGV
jgi:hypothetical protein